ncbi:WYL domain-containing protein [Patescibacteria group bacterium]|nr:WYL domain-containing protein [Patescibacteria group bacterium]MBU1663635.1 WYL domain-containing protein [Patescibacteria group bacterium]MBU1933759.1 WYL domain-containing protein [Patescibacteria group bacterium]MBU2007659.1 WYL domain-containing protein [Patescibacteria group bacterium]MBU2233413.1 WYL domain-containing protein [Patescibacteria group bacterium]
MKKTLKYTKEMHEYLAWRLFREMYGATEWAKEEANEIDGFVKEAGSLLTDDEIKLVENRVRRMKNEYGEQKLEELREQYWDELGDDDEDYDYGNDDFIKFEVDYNEKFYEIWKSSVAKRQTVKLKYDSTTSGVSDRLVDPYKSSAPYGEGYCHKRKEVRKFRFDRVIDIEMTDKKFVKPKIG